MKMADNFFSILLNRRAEIWMDPGKHFRTGEEVAFTVGAEGDARNWYYIVSASTFTSHYATYIIIIFQGLAEQYLEKITHNPEPSFENGFICPPVMALSEKDLITRAPVLASGCVGVWSTNIPMFSPSVLDIGVDASDLQSADAMRRKAMGDANAQHYTLYPLPYVGDGLSHTIFRSISGA